MKTTNIRIVLAALGSALLQAWPAFAAESTAPNLARSREHIRDAGNRKFFDYEMGNTETSPAELGEKLPDGLARDALLSALLGQPAARISKDVRVGAVAHPALPGVHVVWAYIPFDFKNRAPRLFVGLLKGEAREKVAAGQWISEPIHDMELAQDEVPLTFDFCSFPLGRLGRAFGLRTLTHGCGAGGSICSATNLLLFVSVEGKLAKVFDAQVAFFGNFGGDWHEDGTRDHTVEESNAIVRLKGGRSKTAAPPVIEVVLVGKRAKQQRWTWQAQEAAEHADGAPVTDVGTPGWYVTEDPELMGTVNNDPTNRPAHRFAPPRTLAQLEQKALPPWRGLGVMPGVGGGVNAAAIGLRGELYVGGVFEFAGDVPARNVAVWNGHAWSALGAGIEKEVKALTVARSGKLYVASTDRVSVWNGSTWSTLGHSVFEHLNLIALVVDGAGVVYRASQEQVSMWNGSTWSVLANGWEGRLVRALAVDGAGRLYAGGWAGKNRNSNLAMWDGSRWSGVGGGTDNFVSSLAVDRTGKLYVGGTFQHAGGQTAHSLAIWADGAWRSGNMGDLGPEGKVDRLMVDPQGGLYVEGRLEGLGPGFTSRARWNGSSWSVPPSFALAIDISGAFYAGDREYGELPFTTLRRWDGHDGSKLGSGMDEQAAIVAIAGPDDLYVATTSNDSKKSTVARWKKGAWSDLRCPLHRVEALTVDGAGNLVAGGRLPKGSDGWPPSGVFRWNGTAWSPLAQQRLGSILALAADGAGNLYVAGEFSELAGAKAMSIARWDGHAWLGLDAGISDGRNGPGRVSALAVDAKGNLYAAGELAAAGGSPARNIARWDGHAWSALGKGTAFAVRAFAVARTGQVFAGDGWSRVVAWDGHAWSPMAPGMTPQILALATDAAGSVFAAGTAVSVEGRLTSGGIPSEADRRVGQVVKWTDGAWVPLGVFDAEVSALATDPSGGIHAAGPFLIESGRPVGHVTRLDMR